MCAHIFREGPGSVQLSHSGIGKGSQTLTINRVQSCVLVDKEKSQPHSKHRGSAYCVFNALYDTAVGKCMDAMGSENRVRCVALYACV